MGKMMILTFNDNEEDMFRHIMSYVSVGARAFTTWILGVNMTRLVPSLREPHIFLPAY